MGLEVWKKYRNMLAVDFFDSKEMVIVERPFMDVMSKLSPACTVHELCINVFLFSFFRYHVDDNWVPKISLHR